MLPLVSFPTGTADPSQGRLREKDFNNPIWDQGQRAPVVFEIKIFNVFGTAHL